MIVYDTRRPHDLIEICVDLLTICQINCGYCYARNDPLKPWNMIMTKDDIDFLLSSISRTKAGVELSYMGGEPTLHPLLNYAISKADKLDNIKKILVYTNGIKDFNYFKTDKLSVCLNWHPANVPVNDFLKSIDNVSRQNIDLSVAVCILPKYKEGISIVESKCRDLNIPFEPTYITVNDKTKIYNKACDEEDAKTFNYNGKMMSIRHAIENKFNRFKGWKCFLNCYTIGVDMSITLPCVNMHDNLRSTPTFFDDLELRYVICPHDSCESACWLENPKQPC